MLFLFECCSSIWNLSFSTKWKWFELWKGFSADQQRKVKPIAKSQLSTANQKMSTFLCLPIHLTPNIQFASRYQDNPRDQTILSTKLIIISVLNDKNSDGRVILELALKAFCRFWVNLHFGTNQMAKFCPLQDRQQSNDFCIPMAAIIW